MASSFSQPRYGTKPPLRIRTLLRQAPKAIATCRTPSTELLPGQKRLGKPLDGLQVRDQDVAADRLDAYLVEGRWLQHLRRDLRLERTACDLDHRRNLVGRDIGLQAAQALQQRWNVDLGLGVVEFGEEGEQHPVLTIRA